MSAWSFLAGAYIITLDTEARRHEMSRDELHRVGLLPLTTYFYAQRHRNGGKQGCYESHRDVLRDAAKRRPQQPILIMEDDVMFTKDWEAHMKHVHQFMQHAPANTWDIFLLGYLPLKSTKVGKHIQKVVCGALTHAYIVHPRLLQDIDAWLPPYDGRHYDHVLMCDQCSANQLFKPHQACMGKPRNLQVYALKPMIAMQRHDNTSNAAQSSQMVTRTLANARIMRSLANTAETVATPTLVTYLIVLVALLCAGVLVTIIVVPVVMSRKARKLKVA